MREKRRRLWRGVVDPVSLKYEIKSSCLCIFCASGQIVWYLSQNSHPKWWWKWREFTGISEGCSGYSGLGIMVICQDGRFKIGGFELCWFKIGGSIVVHAGWPEKALSSLLLIVSAAAKTLLIEAAWEEILPSYNLGLLPIASIWWVYLPIFYHTWMVWDGL